MQDEHMKALDTVVQTLSSKDNLLEKTKYICESNMLKTR
jgi:hypothetical protein